MARGDRTKAKQFRHAGGDVANAAVDRWVSPKMRAALDHEKLLSKKVEARARAWKIDSGFQYFVQPTSNGYYPSPKQQEMLDWVDPRVQHTKHVLYGGAVAGGKTCCSVDAVFRAMLYYPGFTWWGGRRSDKAFKGTALKDFFLPQCEWLQENFGLRFEYMKEAGRIELYNGPGGSLGSTFTHLPMASLDGILGGNIDGLYIEEGYEVPRTVYGELMNRLRGSSKNPVLPCLGEDGRQLYDEEGRALTTLGWPLRLIVTTNPGRGWVKEWYEDSKAGKQPPERKFIQAFWKDNPKNPQDYAKHSLAADPSARNRAALDGYWGQLPGQVFQDFDKSNPKMVRSFTINGILGLDSQAPDAVEERHHIKYIGYDFSMAGFTALVAGFIHVDTSGAVPVPRLYIYDEFYKRGSFFDEVAEFIHQYPDARVWVDRYAFTTQADKKGEAIIADMMRDTFGVWMEPANEREKSAIVPGVTLMRQWLREGRLVIHERCENVIKGFEGWMHVKKDSEDGDFFPDKFDDFLKDQMDAVRYLCINVQRDMESAKVMVRSRILSETKSARAETNARLALARNDISFHGRAGSGEQLTGGGLLSQGAF